MPQVIALTCPVCGAPLKPGQDSCGFCGSYIVIKLDLPRLDHHNLNRGLIQEHITTFRTRIRASSFDEEAHYGLGIAYYNLGLLNEAADELKQAARLMPENPHIQAQLAAVLRASVQAGNPANEPEMRTRIKNTLKLDPTHLDANLMNADVLVGERRFEAAIGVLTPLVHQDRAQVTPKVVAATTALFNERLAARDWRGVQRCWTTLATTDRPSAKGLMLRFLRGWEDLVPRRVDGTRDPTPLLPSPGIITATNVAPVAPVAPGHGLPSRQPGGIKRGLIIVAWMVGGFVIGFILSIVLVAMDVSSSGFALAVLLLWIGLPIAAGIVAFKRTKSDRVFKQTRTDGSPTSVAAPRALPIAPPPPAPLRSTSSRVARKDLLAGLADFATTQRVANEVVEKATKLDATARAKRSS